MEEALADPTGSDVPATVAEVIRYFLHNREAADTLEGIARWRLIEEKVQRSVSEVDQALDWLVARGFLLERSRRGSAPIFRLNRRKATQAERLVGRASSAVRATDKD